ncbi:MAG: metallophosphoesterase, partial [Luteimonas sp.]|nr:metallophosphoesterase [Luteimonas sp.]
RDNGLLREHLLPVIRARGVDLVLQGHDHVYGRRLDEGGRLPVFAVSVAGAKQYRLSARARDTMAPVGEDTQLFQVIRVDGDRLRYEARTATGRLYDAFELVGDRASRRLLEQPDGRIGQRACERARTPKGRADRCWE